MKNRLTLVVVALQLAVLVFMAGEREWILRTGRTLLLRTAPIDPRDPMRGDYVRFDYEIAHVPKAFCRDEVAEWLTSDWRSARRLHDRVVYAVLKIDPEGIADLASVSERRPAEGVFLRGRVDSVDGQTLILRLGVEALFTEQNKARDFEKQQRDRAGAPLNIEVAVSAGGTAVMKDYHWEPVGITFTADRVDRPAAANGTMARPAVIRGGTVELKNYSDQPVAIVIRPNGESFRFGPANRFGRTVEWANEEAPPRSNPGMVKVLRAGESYREHLDFTTPRWRVREVDASGKPGPARTLAELENPWNAWLRLEYAAPSRADTAGLPDEKIIRHSRIRSRAFGATGGWD